MKDMTKMDKPNVIYILADDLGYGDLSCYSSHCKIPTPNLDKLSSQGMRFTDAHAGAAVCTPSRYGILTGQHCFRAGLEKGICLQWEGSLINNGRTTLANLFKRHEYSAACIGKWHLGIDWKYKENKPDTTNMTPLETAAALEAVIDFTASFGGGPIDCGFDSYFGVDVPNFPPYTWFVDRDLAEVPTVIRDFKEVYPIGMRPGISTPDWDIYKVSEVLSEKAVEYIHSHKDEPFFLYYALTGPHEPVVPTERFKGCSEVGSYGDYVVMMDWAVGEVMRALEENNISDNTILVFTSDNGAEVFAYDRIQKYHHYSSGDLRGLKRDSWEGGHRVPLIIRWPNNIAANSVVDNTVSLLDFFATTAEILGEKLSENEGEDSLSMLSLLMGREYSTDEREGIIYHSAKGVFSIRVGDWALIDSSSGDDNNEPEWFKKERGYKSHNKVRELYNLNEDYIQKDNQYGLHPEIEKYMIDLLDEYKKSGRSVKRKSC